LLTFAQQKGFNDKLHPISLGQGQGPKAAALIKSSMQTGEWVMLQNCHLAASWMPSLEKIVLEFAENKDTIHEDFRLFLESLTKEPLFSSWPIKNRESSDEGSWIRNLGSI
jgi:dynein heavy chain